MKNEIFAVGNITDATGKEYEIKVRGFRYDDKGRTYGLIAHSDPPESWTEINDIWPVKIFVNNGGFYIKYLCDFDDIARAQMLELLETEGVSVHEND